jgi:holo-[acyl-carrier protein] synthase
MGSNNRSNHRTDTETELDETAPDIRLYSGTDIVSIPRIAELIEEFGESVLTRVFTPTERRYCEEQPTPAQHYGARWAAKESFLKLLNESMPAVPTSEIGIVRTPVGPELSLGPAAETALADCLSPTGATVAEANRSVSLSHDLDSGYASAHVVVAAPESETGETNQ